MREFEIGTLLWAFRKNDGPHATHTDKFRSRHAHYYEEAFSHLKDEVTSLLEIGINKGGSIRAWRDFFTKATIHALDIREIAVQRVKDEERVEAQLVNTSNRDELVKWAEGKTFDIVIDDGSHCNNDQINAFEVLWPLVKPGGYFVIEDTKVAWNAVRINPGYAPLGTYINDLVRPVTINSTDILEMTIRPNMVVFRKKRVDEPTIEKDVYEPDEEGP